VLSVFQPGSSGVNVVVVVGGAVVVVVGGTVVVVVLLGGGTDRIEACDDEPRVALRLLGPLVEHDAARTAATATATGAIRPPLRRRPPGLLKARVVTLNGLDRRCLTIGTDVTLSAQVDREMKVLTNIHTYGDPTQRLPHNAGYVTTTHSGCRPETNMFHGTS
jgi:hypothetical protein